MLNFLCVVPSLAAKRKLVLSTGLNSGLFSAYSCFWIKSALIVTVLSVVAMG